MQVTMSWLSPSHIGLPSTSVVEHSLDLTLLPRPQVTSQPVQVVQSVQMTHCLKQEFIYVMLGKFRLSTEYIANEIWQSYIYTITIPRSKFF